MEEYHFDQHQSNTLEIKKIQHNAKRNVCYSRGAILATRRCNTRRFYQLGTRDEKKIN